MIFYADPATKAYHGGGKKNQLALQTRRGEGTEMKRTCEKERRKYEEQRKKERALRTV